MSALIIPTIGAKGFYKLKAPFNSFLHEDEQYSCQGVRSLGDYIGFNEDPLNNIYLYYGLTEEDFNNDVANNMFIVSLQSENGQWIYVPASYLSSYPIMNGIPYQNIMLGVSLGAVPNTVDLAPIQTLIANVVYENYGVQPIIKPVILSKPKLIDVDSHNTIQNARLIRATQRKTDYGRYRELQTQYDQLQERYRILEEFVKDNFIPDTPVAPA